jgi:hypothetical protein
VSLHLLGGGERATTTPWDAAAVQGDGEAHGYGAAYGDAKVANRESRVGHGATEKGP